MDMDSRTRLLAALDRKTPDRLPVTTHHVMPYFLEQYLPGFTDDQFFDYFGLDPIKWLNLAKPNEKNGEYYADFNLENTGLHQVILRSDWQIKTQRLADPKYQTIRYTFFTPSGDLTMVLQSNEYTSWISEHLIKEKDDIDILGKHMIAPTCDVTRINKLATEWGGRGLVRGHIPGFDVFGQPGCWQDAACLVGIENLIIATYDDPAWVHTLLGILKRRKLIFVQSLIGADYDLLELGGGDASTTVISPGIFEKFVAPYDAELIAAAHGAGQRIVYHTCGGMMPILEQIADLNPNAMETFTPIAMGGDTDLAQAKKRIGSRVCMIGGFDQFHHLKGCTVEETRTAVRQCFSEAGENGGFILSPSDHFFDAELELLKAFAEEARNCRYH